MSKVRDFFLTGFVLLAVAWMALSDLMAADHQGHDDPKDEKELFHTTKITNAFKICNVKIVVASAITKEAIGNLGIASVDLV